MKIFFQPILFFIFLSWIGLAEAQLYDLPFQRENLDPGEVILWDRAWHSGPGHIQRFGYDLDAAKFNAEKKQWVINWGSANDQYYLYGKKVYAMRGGKIIACWRNAPENPSPGPHHAELGDEDVSTLDTRIYGGGNGVWIEHSDGSRAEYAHFITGTVPSSLCPHNSTYFANAVGSPDVTQAWPEIRVSAAQQVQVHAGQFLGQVGNSGTSSNPHLHIHVENGGTAGTTKSGGSPLVINFRRGRSSPKSMEVNMTSFAGNPIPTGPVLILPWAPRKGEPTDTAILQLLQLPLRGTGTQVPGRIRRVPDTGTQVPGRIRRVPDTGTQVPDRIKPIPVPRR